ncbi:Kinesin-like protein KIN-13A [Camellia lanceoleosa]|uniref:Kinesin-like protein KIN-13A n=1 Tax=Camellia lanceoleosa TaxID=1840588 RepID=A0ACC0FQV9_9ERIC|nr:Kinesin-like protein KIN-13A [Camellia lanceoleosa]
MQQSNAAAATALYDHPGGWSRCNRAMLWSDAGDAVMARWLQSAGLQHLASPLASAGIDHRLLPNLLMQGMEGFPIKNRETVLRLAVEQLLNSSSWLLCFLPPTSPLPQPPSSSSTSCSTSTPLSSPPSSSSLSLPTLNPHRSSPHCLVVS